MVIKKVCPECNGSGDVLVKHDFLNVDCCECFGSGVVYLSGDCGACGGSGRVAGESCDMCFGSGLLGLGDD